VTAQQARIEQTEAGATAASPGWFVLNLADSAWMRSEVGGEWTDFEPKEGFEQYGIGVHVLQPGQPNGKYHSENVQEDFLVLSGECILVVEEEERRLKAWDFFYCPPWTEHVIVGAGNAPCVVLAVGSRGKEGLVYPANEVAIKHGAGVEKKTSSGDEAYAGLSKPKQGPAPEIF
jgi:uncharacterized cupin superfamily protein